MNSEGALSNVQFLTVRREEGIAFVTLDRPPVNAVNQQMYTEIRATFEALNQHGDLRAVVFTGAGQKAFCAGNDLNEFLTMMPDNAAERMRIVREAFWSIYDCVVPVVGAINGPALGTGLALAASCDILVASERATFGLPEINVGVMGGASHLSRLVPEMVMRRLFYSGQAVAASEMLRWGAVAQVVPADQLLESARNIAMEIARKSPVAVRFAKRSLNTIEFMDLKKGYEFEQRLSGEFSASEDSKEAVRAYFERRAPQFRGR